VQTVRMQPDTIRSFRADRGATAAQANCSAP